MTLPFNHVSQRGHVSVRVANLPSVKKIGFLSFAYPDTMHAMYHTPMGWVVS